MPTYTFALLNVFAETPFGGNPLVVFEDARGMDATLMQALARQFNYSETTFLLPSSRAAARVRVFTPTQEVRFAGHPALGSAHVVRERLQTGDAFQLEFEAGCVDLAAQGDIWQFKPPVVGEPQAATVALPSEEIATLLGLEESDLLGPPLWMDTGAQHLMVPVRSVEAVRRAAPDSRRFDIWPSNSQGRKVAYVFARDHIMPDRLLSRFFSVRPSGAIAEDPGTGSACANLGAWLLREGVALPARYEVEQGEAVNRKSLLRLALDADGTIRVGGRVLGLGSGSITV
ncbi:phenazine biosynthesis protein PhzF family [Noviherbaspirillum humi]|uniref:Phenazine biosynthesis protein PhzF family n=1 Tax=Noviherbaspirillum humi TaxID=1688639 RepID=A0A239EUG3_9BURK|nr:PhzF family phenazine biosynthesis protein [Noviherbaspirillum humi]SNS48061.1 phenazine biosynthesis protein PhzF family [Noviherbaspirillum humi]